MAYNFQKYNLDRIQYLGAPYDTGSITQMAFFSSIYMYTYTIYTISIQSFVFSFHFLLPFLLSLYIFFSLYYHFLLSSFVCHLTVVIDGKEEKQIELSL